MTLQPSSPFENIRSPSPSGTVSSVGTPRSFSSSLTGSPRELQSNFALPEFSETPKPPVTPSLLDSPLPRKLPPLSPARPSSPTQFPQHSRYYFEDEMAVFLVEDCLFRVHRYHLDRESQVFPKGTGSNRDPIELQGVTRTEFESLLDFLYVGMHNETAFSLAAWTSLLSISTHFEMNRIRSRAIAEVVNFQPRIDPVDQVVLAVKHAIPEWLPLGYAAICQREDAIEVGEAMKLGLETTVLLAKAREAVRKANDRAQKTHSHSNVSVTTWNGFDAFSSSTCPPPPIPDPSTPFDASLVDRVLEEIFWRPLPSAMEAEPKEQEDRLVEVETKGKKKKKGRK